MASVNVVYPDVIVGVCCCDGHIEGGRYFEVEVDAERRDMQTVDGVVWDLGGED